MQQCPNHLQRNNKNINEVQIQDAEEQQRCLELVIMDKEIIQTKISALKMVGSIK